LLWLEREQSVSGDPCSCEALEIVRIEQGYPWFGVDISEDNLPQEVGRNLKAISFTKGCYLGQETVARIDALGHVNKTLCGVAFNGEALPTAGLELFAADKVVGQITSACWSPKLGRPLALAYVRRGQQTPGTKLTSSLGEAEVVALPV
jgi:folate-binding protein YgfZ